MCNHVNNDVNVGMIQLLISLCEQPDWYFIGCLGVS